MALLPLVFVALALAGDARVGGCVLPVLREGGAPSSSATLVSETATSLLVELPGFRNVPLEPHARERILRDAPCRELSSCLQGLVPAQAELVLDPRLQVREGLLALDLRLLDRGEVVGRHASAVSTQGLDGTLRQELPLLLASRSSEDRGKP